MFYNHILPYIPNFILRFFINIILTYDLYYFKRYHHPSKEFKILDDLQKAEPIEFSLKFLNVFKNFEYSNVFLGPLKYTFGTNWTNLQLYELSNSEKNTLVNIEKKLILSELSENSYILDTDIKNGCVIKYLAEKYPKLNFIGYSHNVQCVNYMNSLGIKNIKIYINRNAIKNHTYSAIISMEEFNVNNNYEKILSNYKKLLTDDGFIFIQYIGHRENTIVINNTYLFNNLFNKNSTYILPSVNLLNNIKLENLKIKYKQVLNGTNYSNTVEMWLNNLHHNKEKFIDTYLQDNSYIYHMFRLYFLIISETMRLNNGNEFMTVTVILE